MKVVYLSRYLSSPIGEDNLDIAIYIGISDSFYRLTDIRYHIPFTAFVSFIGFNNVS